MDKYLIGKLHIQNLSTVQNSSSSSKKIRVNINLEILKEHPGKNSWSHHYHCDPHRNLEYKCRCSPLTLISTNPHPPPHRSPQTHTLHATTYLRRRRHLAT